LLVEVVVDQETVVLEAAAPTVVLEAVQAGLLKLDIFQLLAEQIIQLL